MNYSNELNRLSTIVSEDPNSNTKQSNSVLTQYPGGQVLEPQQSAESQLIVANKVREAKAKADKAEMQIAQATDPNASQKASGFGLLNYDWGSNGALALNAPFATNGYTYTDASGFNNSEPLANNTVSNQKANQPAPQQNINNNLAQTNQPNTVTVTGVDGTTLPLVNLEDMSPQDIPPDMTYEEMAAYNTAKAEKVREQVEQRRREQAEKDAYNQQLQEAKAYAETYGVTTQGTPYRKINGKAYPISAFSDKGKEIIARFSAPIMAIALGTALPQNIDPDLNPSVQQGAVANAGNAIATQQQQFIAQQQQGALATNNLSYGIDPAGTAVYRATPQELEGINIAKTAALNGKISDLELNNMIDSVANIKDNAIEELNRQAQLVGGATGLEYALGNADASAEKVAQDMVAKYGLNQIDVANITREIDKLATKYRNLTPAVIASVISGHSRKDANGWYKTDYGWDTDLGGGLEYLDNEVNDTLKALNNRSAATSYENIKDTYHRCKEMMSILADAAISADAALKNYKTHQRDLNAWGPNPEDSLHRDWLKEDLENTNKYAYDAIIKAEKAFSRLGNFYRYDQRNTYPEKAKATSK